MSGDRRCRTHAEVLGLGEHPVLADTALRASDIDEAAAAQAQEDAERALSESAAELDYGRVQAQLAAATAQQRTLEALRKLRR